MSSLRSRSVCLALFAFSASVRAAVPAANATHDPEQNLPIQNRDVYELPANKIIYHGTFSKFDDFTDPSTIKMGKPRYNTRNNATWFGADRVTSEAMSFFRYCQTATPLRNALESGLAALEGKDAQKRKAALDTLKKINVSTSALDPGYWPYLLEVKVNHNINFILVPHGAEGHKVALAKVGYQWTNPRSSLYGVNSDVGIAVMNESKLCEKKVHVQDGKIVTDKQHPEVQLRGWRAPWDQNEIAVCSTAFVRAQPNQPPFSVIKTEVLLSAEQDKLNKAFAPVADLKVHGDKVKLREVLEKEAEDEGHLDQQPVSDAPPKVVGSEIAAVEELLEKQPQPMTAYVKTFIAVAKEVCESKRTQQGAPPNDRGAFDIYYVK